ncbi:D-alanyl-D-alanine carboxypeptidase/D-alanyl-D-alanine endopeptidase [Haloprofundus marisrubri]|uniref:D-alanyl-D-alanine carboxypeptidase/D-alanyl-D-alanine endopeptidase n=1 Tax=Haloprofundus marisrubri TaxID=1514971 RepID=UPI0009E2D85B|nr:D-alanyl-D-alanine carboxypeptidase/D-alanyl-D-alanine-endopeptidase [Haloprofundus marisrubri]
MTESSLSSAVRAVGNIHPAATASVLIETTEREILESLNAEKVVPPASTTKLFTTALALDSLGESHQFETSIATTRKVSGRQLNGDCIVTSSITPDLERSNIAVLAQSVASSNISCVDGNVILKQSPSRESSYPLGWAHKDIRQPYGAPVSALSVSRNQVEVTVSRTDDGPEITVSPQSTAVTVHEQVVIADKEDESDVSVKVNPSTFELTVAGRLCAEEISLQAPILNPSMHAAAVFCEEFDKVGISITGGVKVSEKTAKGKLSATQFGTISSRPLTEIITETNRQSDNFLAEQLALALTTKGDGRNSSTWENYTVAFFEELDSPSCRLYDGSGLSRYNLVSAEAIVKLLSWSHSQPWCHEFFNSLPAPGEGTLTTRLHGQNVRAKTGTLRGVRALSGIKYRHNKPDVFFALLLSNLTTNAKSARDTLDDVVKAIPK